MSCYIQRKVENRFEVIIVGDSGTGKSALLHAFTRGTFNDNALKATINDFFTKVIEFKIKVERNEDKWVKANLLLWDTAGQEQFRAITQSYYRRAIGVILVYDVTRRKSFDDLRVWLEDFKRASDPSNVVFLVVGAKADRSVGDQVPLAVADQVPVRQVFAKEGRRWAQNSEHEMLWMETSSKDHLNVDEAFELLAKTIYCKVQSGQLTLPSLHSDTRVLDQSELGTVDSIARSQGFFSYYYEKWC